VDSEEGSARVDPIGAGADSTGEAAVGVASGKAVSVVAL
jgi:hypothetical protein